MGFKIMAAATIVTAAIGSSSCGYAMATAQNGSVWPTAIACGALMSAAGLAIATIIAAMHSDI